MKNTQSHNVKENEKKNSLIHPFIWIQTDQQTENPTQVKT